MRNILKNINHKSLLSQFALFFAAFAMVFTVLCFHVTHKSQERIYAQQVQTHAKMMGDYLTALLELDGDEFVYYQKYFMEHHDEMIVPADFEDIGEAYKAYEEAMLKYHPGKRLGVNITFDELDPEVQRAFAVYNHEYYLLEFEKARDAFGLDYAYYATFDSDKGTITYILDAVRELRKSDPEQIDLGITFEYLADNHEKIWECWNTGLVPDGFDTFDNNYGKTYAYYTPVIINGEKLGVIATEISSPAFHREIMLNTLFQMGFIFIIITLCLFLLLRGIRKYHISKLEHLARDIQIYSENKDPHIVTHIEKYAEGDDEISTLACQTAEMILELDSYMKDLVKTTKALSQTQEQADAMKRLATKDSLTGIRNKTAYDHEIEKLEDEFRNGFTDFGLAIADLNYLKKINDTYGHEKGNIAICRLSKLICETFAHSPVFRIGGDEFAIVLRGRDLDNIDTLLKQFRDTLADYEKDNSLKPWEKISAAIGYAVYDPEVDKDINSLFKRADGDMYKNKHEMHAERR